MDSTLQQLTSFSVCAHCGTNLSLNSKSPYCCQGCEAMSKVLKFDSWNSYPSQPSVSFYIEGIHCSSCVTILESLPSLAPDLISRSSFRIDRSILELEIKNGAKLSDVGKKISNLGYTPHLLSSSNASEKLNLTENRKNLVELGIAGALAGNVMLMSIPLYSGVTGEFLKYFEWASFFLAVPSLFFSGRSFFKNVYFGIKSKTFPIDAPILIALVVAFFYSTDSLLKQTHELYFDSLTALIFLLLSSRYYLSRLRQSSSLSMGLLRFFQKNEKFKIGQEIELTPGEIHFDGVVIRGSGSIDTAYFTGESEPKTIQAGDDIFSGTSLLYSQSLVVRVTEVGEKTRIANILKQVEKNQQSRSLVEMKSDRLAKGLLSVVLIVAFVTMIYFVQIGQASIGLKRVLALLIVTCPCALALATPLTFAMAMKQSLKEGILIKNPNVFDLFQKVGKIFFDKTGTLTSGQFVVMTDLSQLHERELSLLAALTNSSRHPVSRAIYRTILNLNQKLKIATFQSIEEKPGIGVFGNSLENINYSLQKSNNLDAQFTEVTFYENDLKIISIELKDELRPGTAETIKFLKSKGYVLTILSGDKASVVTRIGNDLDFDEYKSNLSPEEKAQFAKGSMMVGDGINDTLALSSAQIGFAVQGGLESVMNASDLYSLKGGISGLMILADYSNLVKKTLIQNFIISTTYNWIGGTLSILGYMNPLLAAILMPMSAFSVFTLTLSRFKNLKKEGSI